MAPTSTAMILFAATCLFLAVSALPSSGPTSQLTTMPSLKAGNEGRCITEWYHPYCKQFSNGDYNLFLPNARGHTNIYQAISEFNDFIPLLNSNCSEKLGVLLCFLYFPSCGQNRAVKPCKSLCEEVTDPEGECTHIMETVVSPTGCLGKGVVWPDHLKCNATTNPFTTASTESEPIYAEDQPCAPGLQAGDEYKKNPWIPEVHGRFSHSKCNPVEPSTEPPTEQTTTEQPTEPPTPPCCVAEACSNNKRTFRTSVNSKAFTPKNEYTFAFRGIFNSLTTYNCKHAANFTVIDQCPIKLEDGSCPMVHNITTSHALVLGKDDHVSCPNCFEDLQAGVEYIVAGVCKEDECRPGGDMTMHVSCESKSTSLIAQASEKNLKNLVKHKESCNN